MAGSGGLPLRAGKIPKILTLPKSNSESPWKRRGWKTTYPFWEGLFSGAFLLVSGSVTWICFLVIGFFAFDQGRNDTEITPEESSF